MDCRQLSNCCYPVQAVRLLVFLYFRILDHCATDEGCFHRSVHVRLVPEDTPKRFHFRLKFLCESPIISPSSCKNQNFVVVVIVVAVVAITGTMS